MSKPPPAARIAAGRLFRHVTGQLVRRWWNIHGALEDEDPRRRPGAIATHGRVVGKPLRAPGQTMNTRSGCRGNCDDDMRCQDPAGVGERSAGAVEPSSEADLGRDDSYRTRTFHGLGEIARIGD